MYKLSFVNSGFITVGINGMDVAIRSFDKQGREDWWANLACNNAREFATAVMAMARVVDPESATQARLLAEAEADLEAQLKRLDVRSMEP